MPNKIRGKIILNQVFILLFLLAAINARAVNGYKITLNSNLKNHKVYMYYQYGENQYPADTAFADNDGVAVFEDKASLTGGVFVLYLAPDVALEFLLTNENEFTIRTDTADILGKTNFTGSRENTLYYEFLRKMKFNDFQKEMLKKKLARVILKPDSVLIVKNMIRLYDKQNDLLRQQTIDKAKGLFVANLLKADADPDVPDNLPTAEWNKEMKLHFFDKIDFSDERLAYSPVLYNKYKEYINDYVYHQGDSIIKACDTILKKAAAGNENFKWSLYFLSSSFERSSVPGQDKVFVHLVEEYYMKSKSWWLSKEQLNGMHKKSQSLKRLFVGSVCPDFTAQDSSEKPVNLHKNIKGLTVLYFWSYDCEHCLEETPKLAKWIKAHPQIHLITACATPDEERWKQKLKEFQMPGVHMIDPELKANYIALYSIFNTPEIFVIDKNKKILAKYLSDTKELEEYIGSIPKK